MHEQALIDDLVREITDMAAAENSTRVSRIDVRLGALAHLTPDHFVEHFEKAAAGTIAEGAHVEISACHDPLEPRAAEIVLRSIDIES